MSRRVRDDQALVPAGARDDLRALIAQSPGTKSRGLSSIRVTLALDAIAYTLEVPAFRTLVAEEVPASDRPRLLSGLCDLSSYAMLMADPNDAAQAMMAMTEDDAADGQSRDRHVINAFSLYTVLACAHYMCERDDWEEVLDVVIDTTSTGVERTLRHWIVAAVWYEAGCPRRVGTEVAEGLFEPIDELAPGVFDDSGIEQDEGLKLMAEMLREGIMPEFDRDEFVAARERFVAAQQSVREEAEAARREREAAAKKADELDI